MRKLRYWFHFQAHDHVFLQLWGQTCNRILPEKTYDLQIRSNQFKYLILFAVFVMIFNWIARKWLFATLQLISASQPNHCFFVHTSCLTSTCKSINPFSAIESKCFDGNWQEHNRSPNLVSNHVKPAPPPPATNAVIRMRGGGFHRHWILSSSSRPYHCICAGR